MPREPWTTGKDVVSHVRRLWERGDILSSFVTGRDIFPLSCAMKGPSSREYSEMFDDSRRWAASLISDSRAHWYRVETRTVNHRVLGRNEFPHRIWVDAREDVLRMLHKKRDADLFLEKVRFTEEECPALLSYMARRPIEVSGLGDDWDKLVSVALWMICRPKPDIYIRQMNLPGVDTKFIEKHKGILSKLLDLVLSKDAVNERSAQSRFEERYGFKTRPELIRFRLPSNCLAFPRGISDISVPSEEFAALDLGFGENLKVLVVENNINFLSIPRAKNLLIIWGLGYGFDFLKEAGWLARGEIYYWGDIDTHGFAILNQFRAIFPGSRSILMDRDTLTRHRELWVDEKTPASGDLQNLAPDEEALYSDLRLNVLGPHIRLEQERIGYGLVMDALSKITGAKLDASINPRVFIDNDDWCV
ncbi:MAG: DUF2220 family protein [Synergistaceae bacterium]|jgi:hypothetical protein|nr:DUF2220 family protein [Synergistaceae bacterium]